MNDISKRLRWDSSDFVSPNPLEIVIDIVLDIVIHSGFHHVRTIIARIIFLRLRAHYAAYCAVALFTFVGTFVSAPTALHAQYRLSINPTLLTPLREFAGVVSPYNASINFSIYHFRREGQLSLGGSFGMQYFNFRPDRKGSDYLYELLTFPFCLGFHVNLLPEFILKPYYGAEAGALFFRYSTLTPQLERGLVENVGVILAPNGGFRYEITNDMWLDVNVRYQIVFHEPFQYGPTERYRSQGFTALGWMLGFSYAINGNGR
jgi:hypothetical protein